MELLGQISIPELTEIQLQALTEIAEKTARDYVLSKVPKRNIIALDIAIESAGAETITISVDVDLTISPLMTTHDAQKLASEASKVAFQAIEQYLRELPCQFKT